jgi:GNAT superfamily N-acetyltransferase
MTAPAGSRRPGGIGAPGHEADPAGTSSLAASAGAAAGSPGASRERGFSIRPAEPRDLGRLMELIVEFARYEKLEALATGTGERLAASLWGGAWPRIEALVAEARGDLVGYAIFFGTYSTFWTRPLTWLEDLYVSEPARGRGIGRALLAEVARIALERGCARLDWAVLDWNEPAMRFYESLGATRSGGWYAYRLSGEALEKAAGGS